MGSENNNKANAEIIEAFQAFDNVRVVGFDGIACWEKEKGENKDYIN